MRRPVRFPIPVLLLGFYLASACATLCRTPCGLAALEGNCADLAHFEGRVTQRFAQAVPDWEDAKACRALEGWLVRVEPRDEKRDQGCGLGAWRHPTLGCVEGLSDFKARVISLPDTAWSKNALAHELGHVVGVSVTRDPGQHCRWADWAFRDALTELNGYADTTHAERACFH